MLEKLGFKEKWDDRIEHLKPGKYIIYRRIIGGRIIVTRDDGALLQRKIHIFFREEFISDIERELQKLGFQNYHS